MIPEISGSVDDKRRQRAAQCLAKRFTVNESGWIMVR